MADKMTHQERVVASLKDEPVDRLTTYPIACGVSRRTVGDGTMLYRDWATDPKKFAAGFIQGQKTFDLDFTIGLMDLSVIAGDFGAHVRMDEQNTPFVDVPVIKSTEDYEKLQMPDPSKGRSGVIVEGTRLFSEALKTETITSGFLEGPLLSLTQCAGAEKVLMDLYNNPSAVHKALAVFTEYLREMVKRMGTAKPNACMWDYLWGSYSCLGDKEYHEFEGQHKYAGGLNELLRKEGMALAIHNCADLPHMDSQVKEMKPDVYTMAYYPLIPGSPSAKVCIEKGYADNCVLCGTIDPQGYVRWSKEKMEKVTMDLCHEVSTALCARGLKSKYCIASNCEVPPGVSTKLENIKAQVDAVKKYGQVVCK